MLEDEAYTRDMLDSFSYQKTEADEKGRPKTTNHLLPLQSCPLRAKMAGLVLTPNLNNPSSNPSLSSS
jgi:hypothetical protein